MVERDYFDKTSLEESKKTQRDLLKSISLLIIEILEENKGKNVHTSQNTFKASYPPSVSLSKYLERIVKYTKLENSTLIIVLIFLDRISELFELALTYNNIHRLVFSSVIAAIKVNEDDYYSNEFYAKVGGISLSEANKLEYEFASGMQFNFFVTVELYDQYRNYLKQYIEIE